VSPEDYSQRHDAQTGLENDLCPDIHEFSLTGAAMVVREGMRE
jgi:hypothetical protein